MELEERNYCNGTFTELCLTRARGISSLSKRSTLSRDRVREIRR